MTLAERLFLLSHDPDHEFRAVINLPTLATGLAGAVLVDLVLSDQISVDEDGLTRLWGTSPRGHVRPSDPVARAAFDLIRSGVDGRHALEFRPYPARDLIELLKPDIYQRTQASLVASGMLTVTRRKFRSDRYILADESHVAAIRAAVQWAVRGLNEPLLETAALCALIRAIRMVEPLYMKESSDELIERLNGIVRRVAGYPQPYAGIADIAGAVEAVASDIVVAVYR